MTTPASSARAAAVALAVGGVTLAIPAEALQSGGALQVLLLAVVVGLWSCAYYLRDAARQVRRLRIAIKKRWPERGDGPRSLRIGP